MSDSEDVSSENDSDYVPSAEESSDDEGDQAGHDEVEEDGEDEPTAGKKKATSVKKRRAASTKEGPLGARKRTRTGGIRLSGDEAEEESGGQGSPGQDDATVTAATPADCSKSKSRADDLWASFLSDVGQKPKVKEDSPSQVNETPSQSSAAVKTEARRETERPREGAKVSITKVFDFAGEEVRVTKEVDAESKEARSYLKSLEEVKEKEEMEEDGNASSGSGTSSTAPPLAAKRSAGAGGLSAVLGQIGGKKTKMSTLEKSKMDWDQFKEVEGIGDELATHNRGKAGYIERQAFLDRVDHRTFEIEKSIRLTKSKR